MSDAGSEAVSDEALWHAACLAAESTCDDRVLDDVHAARLAGSRGRALFAHTSRRTAFAFALRVATIDELLQHAIVDYHVHTAVTICGELDDRPYRLGVPSDLRWIELERDSVITYKGIRLAHVQPTCRVNRVGIDVTEEVRRYDILRRVTKGVARGLILTENAFSHFTRDDIQRLATAAPLGLKWWILDTPFLEPAPIVTLATGRWEITACRPLRDEAERLAPARLHQLEIQGDDLGAVWLLHRGVTRSRQAAPLGASQQ